MRRSGEHWVACPLGWLGEGDCVCDRIDAALERMEEKMAKDGPGELVYYVLDWSEDGCCAR